MRQVFQVDRLYLELRQLLVALSRDSRLKNVTIEGEKETRMNVKALNKELDSTQEGVEVVKDNFRRRSATEKLHDFNERLIQEFEKLNQASRLPDKKKINDFVSSVGQFLHISEILSGHTQKVKDGFRTINETACSSSATQAIEREPGTSAHCPTLRTVKSDPGDIVQSTSRFVVYLLKKGAKEVLGQDKCRSKAIMTLCRTGFLSEANTLLEVAIRAKTIRRRDLEPFFLHSREIEVVDYVRRLAREHRIVFEEWVYALLIQAAVDSQDVARVHELLTEMKTNIPILTRTVYSRLESFSFQMQPYDQDERYVQELPNRNIKSSPSSTEEKTNTFQGSSSLPASLRYRKSCCSVCHSLLQYVPSPPELRTQLLWAIQNLPLIKPSAASKVKHFFAKIREMKMDLIIDGANVGFSGLYREADADELCPIPPTQRPSPMISSASSPKEYHLWFEHLEAVLNAAVSYNLRPLIMLHQRHIQRDKLWDKYHSLVQYWEKHKLILPTPSGIEDDICWLYAALFHSSSTKRVYIVTNDLMRDHHFALLSQKFFLQWRDSARVCYKLFHPGTVASLEFPPSYSTVLQFDTKRLTWHMPVDFAEANIGIKNGIQPHEAKKGTHWYCVQLRKIIGKPSPLIV